MTTFRKITFTLILLVLLIPAAAVVCIQFPSVQTALCNYAAKKLSEKLDGEAKVGAIYLSLPNSLIVKDILVTQNAGADTVASIGKIYLKCNTASFMTDNPAIHRIAIEDALLHTERFASLLAPLPKKERDTASLNIPYNTAAVDRLILKNIALTTYNPKPGAKHPDRTKRPYSLDYHELDFTDIDLDVRNIFYSDDSVSLDIVNLAAKEAHGMDVNTFSGKVEMTPKKIHIDNLHYNDSFSDLKTNFFYMDFNSMADFKSFCKDVSLDVDFDHTLLDFRTLQYFSRIRYMELGLILTGHVKGPVARLMSKHLQITSRTGETRLEFEPNIIGLPKGKATMATINVPEIVTNTADLGRILCEVSGGKKKNQKITRFAPGVEFTFNGSIDGLFEDFVAYGNLKTKEMGNVKLDVICRTNPGKGYSIDGYLNSYRLDLGRLLQNEDLGELSGMAMANIQTGRNLAVTLDTLLVDEIGLKKNFYNDIGFSGKISKHEGSTLNFSSNDEWVHFDGYAACTSFDLSNMLGDLHIQNLGFDVEDQHFYVGNIDMELDSDSEGGLITMHSDMADLQFDTDVDLSEFIRKCKEKDYLGANTNFSLIAQDVRPLLDVFAPDLFIHTGTKAHYNVDEEGIGRGVLTSDLIAFKNNYLKGLETRLLIDDEDTVTVRVLADTLQSGNIIASHADINIDLVDSVGFGMFAKVRESRFDLGGNPWMFQASELGLAKKIVHLKDFLLASGDHSLSAGGVLGANLTDTLSIAVNDMDLSLFDELIGEHLDIDGSLNGGGDIVAFLGEDKMLLLDVAGQEINLNGKLMGDLNVTTKWIPEKEGFELGAKTDLTGKKPLDLTGFYYPAGKRLDVDATFDSLHLGFAEPILKSVVSDVGGYLSGGLRAHGKLDSLDISTQNCRIDSMKFTLLYTKVPYIIDGPFSVDNKGVYLDRLTISDTRGHSGRIGGGVTFDRFKDLKINTRINLSGHQALNTTPADNNSFYGQAFASGNVRLSGEKSAMRLDVNASTNPGTVIHIPLSSSGKEQVSILTFIGGKKHYLNAYDSLRSRNAVKKEEKAKNSFDVGLRLEANNDAEIQLDINTSTGDALKARGDGRINISAGADKGFDIKGDYVLSSGSYRFNLMGLVSKDFTIVPGSTIAFNGDVMNSGLDITAQYRTKASISTLIADTTAVGTRRNVDCEIGVTGRLSNPELSFNIDIPDLDPGVKSQVESALNSEDKRMKQMLALLLSGSFVPDQQSGIVNSTTVLYSNVSEIMANQFNNIFRQLDIPLDLGFNYQPGTQGRDVFDVAVSTQLFNNRVSINGNIGNRQFAGNRGKSEIVGDVDVSIKLNKTGRWLLNLFSHSADEYSNYLDQYQRNGLGIVYQEEFDTFKELWRKMFWSKKRKEAEQQRMMEEMRERRQQRENSEVQNDER